MIIMITFRTEKTVDEVTTVTEVEVVFEDKDSASALHAKHRVVDVLCELLLLSDQVMSVEQAQSNLYQTLTSSLINRPAPPGAE